MKTGRRLMVMRLRPFDSRTQAEEARAWIRRETATGADITVLATGASMDDFRDLPVTLWPDGAPRGLLRLLALMRRISWAGFSAVYDLDLSRRTRVYRHLVRPCPPWHSAAALSVCKDKAS